MNVFIYFLIHLFIYLFVIYFLLEADYTVLCEVVYTDIYIRVSGNRFNISKF